MAKSFKRSRSKGNSLPPAKQFDNTMVDDDFEELQRGVSEENIIRHHFNGWAAVMVPCAGPVFEELHTFLLTCVRFLGANRAATPRSHHPPWWNQTAWWVAGCCLCYENAWKTWAFYIDSRLGTNCKSATHNPCIQWFSDLCFIPRQRLHTIYALADTQMQWAVYYTSLQAKASLNTYYCSITKTKAFTLMHLVHFPLYVCTRCVCCSF